MRTNRAGDGKGRGLEDRPRRTVGEAAEGGEMERPL